MKKLKKPDVYFLIAYAYILIPFFIFCIGWMKWYFAIPAVLCILFVFCKMVQNPPQRWEFSWTSIEKEKFVFVAVIILVWVFISGIGGFAFQNEDHIWRNGMFEALVYEKWPVIKEVSIDGTVTARGYSYYMGFWMVPAVIGKIFGIGIGQYFQIIWAFLGTILFYYGICLAFKKIQLWPLIVFVFFSGMDIAGYYLSGTEMSSITSTMHLEWWTKFQFSSFTTQLFWVFNQAIPAWLITILLLLQKNNRCMIVILASAMLNCSMPFVGMIPLCIYLMYNRKYTSLDEIRLPQGHALGCDIGNNEIGYERKWWILWGKDTFTVENILGGGIVGILSFLYLMKHGNDSKFGFIDLNNGGWLVILTFLTIEIGGICFIIYRYQRRNPLFYILLLWLCLCPLLKIYGEANFCMRASIPALTILFIYVVQAITDSYSQKKYLHLAVILIILGIGAVTPMHEFIRTISETGRIYATESEHVRVDAVGIEDVMSNDYESTDINYNLFFKWFAKIPR